MRGGVSGMVCLLAICSWSLSPVQCAADSLPQWQEEWHQAYRLAGDQEISLYRHAIDDAEKANAPVKKRIAMQMGLGQILYSRSRYREAKDAYERGARLAHDSGLKEWEAAVLARVGQCDQRLSDTALTPHRDPAPMLKALELRPGDPSIPSDFRACCYETLTNAYLDNKDFANAEKYCALGLAECRQMGDQQNRINSLLSSKIFLLFAEGKCVDAVNLMDKCLQNQPDSAYLFKQTYKSCARDSGETAIGTTMRALIDKKQIDALEAYAERQLAATAPFASGRWPVDLMLDEITNIPSPGDDGEWLKRIELIRQWSVSKPDSQFACGALADLYTSYAWNARGTDWAKNVTDEGWKSFERRLAKAMQILRDSPATTQAWYSAAQTVALGQGWPASAYVSMVNSGRSDYPKYDPLIFAESYWLLPRWHGDKGQSEQYVQTEANQRGGIEGDILYARCVWKLESLHGNIFKEMSFDWNRTKAGFRQIIARYPNSMKARAEFALLALEAGDRPAIQAAFQNSAAKNKK